MKWRLSGSLLLALGLLVAVGVIVYLVTSIDAIAKRQIEQHGARLTGTAVNVDGVDLDLTGGSGVIRGLRVANPEGFSDADAITLETIRLTLDLASLGGQPLRIERVEVGEVSTRLEVDARGRSNIDVLRRHAKAAGVQEPAASGSTGSPPQQETRLSIARFEFAGGQIVAAAQGEAEERILPFPGLSLRNLGGADGAPPGEIGEEVFVAFTGRVVRSVAVRGAQEAIEKSLGDAAGKAAEGLRGLFE